MTDPTGPTTDARAATPSVTSWERPGATPRRPRLAGTKCDVVVVGAGITGLVSALLLARAGLEVIVLEGSQIGATASGRNTGKVSLLQGTKLSQLLTNHSEQVARSYVEGNREGAAWLRRFCEDHGVSHQQRDAITYAPTARETPDVEAEFTAANRLGVPVTLRDRLDAPFAVEAAAVLPDQFQLDPQALLLALADEVERQGGRIGEEQRVVDVSWTRPPRLRTADGEEFRCRHLVLATGAPVLDRGLYFAKLEARRSYLLAFTSTEQPPGMMISTGSDVRSLRDVPGESPLLLVGGSGHVVGRGVPELEHVERLRSWTADAYPGAVETHVWSAQDYTSHDGVPYVGRLPRGLGSIWLATGYDKWGLTNGAASALRIAGGILGSSPSWARPMERRITKPKVAADLLRRNLQVAAVGARRLLAAETKTVSPALPDRTGEVGRIGLDPRPVGVVGSGCAVRATCSHLGGTLRWNDAERSWDCPLHGSRFAADGAVLEGPAVRPLDRVEG